MYVHFYNKLYLTILLVIVAPIVLNSCFDSSDEAPISADDINGIWIDDNRGVGIISDYGRNLNIVSTYTSQGNSQLRGKIISISGVISESFLSSYRADGGSVFTWFNGNGTVVPKESISATFDSNFYGSLVLDLKYDASLTEKQSSLELISGIWSYTGVSHTVTLTIDAQGNLFGSDTYGCAFLGSVLIPHASINIYKVKLSMSDCIPYPCCDAYPSMSEGSGQAILMDSTNKNDTLIMALTRTVSSSVSMVLRLTRQ